MSVILKDNIDNEIFGIEELKRTRVGPARLQREPREQPLPDCRARFRAGAEKRAAVCAADGGDSQRHRAGESEPEESAAVYTETAIDQVQGAISLIKEGLNEVLDKAPDAKKPSLHPFRTKRSPH
jgi:hypothetical protein